ncbi:GNAT family N-acetyltransferase [Natronomonas sp. EA1]|uniref:GNAT family N-acetyltransferase n=1 Tax=Natronomonas sp. EA1 TaxID=3421655 RepID=UPI003EB9129C
MTIETPDTADADALAELWVALADGQRAFGSHLRADANRDAIRESFLRHIVTDTVRVAREDDAIVGFVTVSIERGRFEQDATRGIIENLYVVPEARGEGVGSALLAAGEDAVSAAGADVIALDVMAENEDARRFYDRHGYRSHRVELEKQSDTS